MIFGGFYQIPDIEYFRAIISHNYKKLNKRDLKGFKCMTVSIDVGDFSRFFETFKPQKLHEFDSSISWKI